MQGFRDKVQQKKIVGSFLRDYFVLLGAIFPELTTFYCCFTVIFNCRFTVNLLSISSEPFLISDHLSPEGSNGDVRGRVT